MSATYEVLEPGGHARLVGNVLDRIARASSNPASSAGSAAALLDAPTEGAWLARESVGDGSALVESVNGNTLRWNQLVNGINVSITTNGITVATVTNGRYTAVGTAEDTSTNAWFAGGWTSTTPLFTLKVGHKYIAKDCAAFSSEADGRRGWTCDIHVPYYFSPQSDIAVTCIRFPKVVAGTTYNTTVYPQLFDLTRMFGAGNEPASVEEFEALYPASYYPYDAGSLLDVEMTGIESTAADESWSSSLAIPATDLRSAGTVRDELREDRRITRVGVVDFGTLTWTVESAWQQSKGLTRLFAPISDAVTGNSENITASNYFVTSIMVVGSTMSEAYCIALLNGRVYVTMPYPEITTAADFTTWLQSHPVTVNYELATPTTTPIDLPLCMSYRTEKGGTERVTVTSGSMSAPPVISARQGADADALRDRALSAIAPVEGATASANYAVGSYLVHGGKLYKVTSAIASGESITPGTNVTATTVMAEIVSLTS